MRATLLSSGKGYLKPFLSYTTGLIYINSLNRPKFLPTRNQKRVRCPVCFQTYYGPFVLRSFPSFPFPQGSPVARVKADPDSSGLPGNVSISTSSFVESWSPRFPNQSHGSPATTSHSKIPSKLRASSTASFLERSSNSSRGSSPGGVSATTPSSSFSSQSPVRPPVGNGKPSRGRPHAMGTGPPKRPSPPRPQAIHVPDYSMGKPLCL